MRLGSSDADAFDDVFIIETNSEYLVLWAGVATVEWLWRSVDFE
jgi:hypothetical protein